MTPIFEPFLMLIFLLLAGAGLHLLGLLDLDFSRRLSRLVIKVTFPATLFVSMYNNIELSALQRGWIFAVIGLVVSIALAVTGHLSGRLLGLGGMTLGTYEILCTNGNNIFLPIPIILTLFGAEYVVYAVLFELGAAFYYWTYGVSGLRGGPRFSVKRLFNVNIAALLLGLTAGLLEIRVYGPILGGLEILGNLSIGSAMLILGSLLVVALQRKSWRREVWGVVVHRLVLSPLIGLPFLLFFDFPAPLRDILLLMLAMPPLLTTALVAASFGADEELAALGVLVPTILSFIIIPVLLIG